MNEIIIEKHETYGSLYRKARRLIKNREDKDIIIQELMSTKGFYDALQVLKKYFRIVHEEDTMGGGKNGVE